MKLEFELDKPTIEEELIIYPVLRKGLQVGTLTLDKSPYAIPKAKIKRITGE